MTDHDHPSTDPTLAALANGPRLLREVTEADEETCAEEPPPARERASVEVQLRHDEVVQELAAARAERDRLNDRIRDLVADEELLMRAVRVFTVRRGAAS